MVDISRTRQLWYSWALKTNVHITWGLHPVADLKFHGMMRKNRDLRTEDINILRSSRSMGGPFCGIFEGPQDKTI